MIQLAQTDCDCSSGNIYQQTGQEKTQSSSVACRRCYGRGWYFSDWALKYWNQTYVFQTAPMPVTKESSEYLKRYNEELKKRRVERAEKMAAKAEANAEVRVITVKQDLEWQERIVRYL